MPIGIYTSSITLAGFNFGSQTSLDYDSQKSFGPVTLPVAKALSAWVKTDADTAAGNLTAGHGLTTGTYDIYWDGGARYDVDCTITTNAVALDGGSGTDFPATANTTVRMSRQTTINTPIDGDNVKLAFARLGYGEAATGERGRLLFEDAAGDDIADLDTSDGINASWTGNGTDKTKVWNIAGGDTNVFTGDIIMTCKASQSSTSLTASLVIAVLEDATP